MKLLQLEQFKVIADTCNMTQAAKKLYISQPTLSISLHILEEELNCKLFDRVGRDLVLNDNGILLLKYTNEIIEKFDEIKNEFDKRDKNKNLTIHFYSTSIYFFALYLSSFFEKNNKCNIKTKIVTKEEILPALLNGKADIAVSPLNEDMLKNMSNRIENIMLIKETLYLSAPLNSKFKDLKEISLYQLTNENFIRSMERSEFPIWVEEILSSEKIKLNFTNEVDDRTLTNIQFDTEYLYFTSSAYITSTKDYRNKRKLIKIIEPCASRNLYLLYLKEHKKQINFFLDYIKNIFYDFFKNND